MSGFGNRLSVCVVAALLQCACASSPVGGTNAKADAAPAAVRPKAAEEKQAPVRASRLSELLVLDIDGDLPILERYRNDPAPVIASNLEVGVEDGLLRYQATYQLEPGDVFASGDPAAATADSPTRFAGQRLGQNVRLRLPKLAGAPLSLGVTTELRNNWLVSGESESQHERANLDWSPGAATVNVQWAGVATAFDAAVALTCDFESTVRLPMHESGDHSEALRVSGRDCVIADGTPYSGVEAQTWGLGYIWSRPSRQSKAMLSVIDPAWQQGVDLRDIEPGYQLGLSHRRDFGLVSAEALVSLRRSSIWEQGRAAAIAGDYAGTVDTDWAANASLTWQLPEASLSANWAQGVDPLWFAPDVRQRSDRFGLALNLSRWMEELIPDASPQFAMKWNWSQVRLPGDAAIGDNSLSLDVALLF